MDGLHPKIWMSVQEAAEYLSFSEDAIERRLVKMPAQGMGKFERGRIRFRRIDDWNALSKAQRQRATPLRLLGEDVYQLLPLPDGLEEMEFNAECLVNALQPQASIGDSR